MKPIIILHGAVFIMHTAVFSDQGNDFLPLRSGFMLKTRKRSHLDLLHFVSKSFEIMTNKFRNYVPIAFTNDTETIALKSFHVGCFLSHSEY
jgi:hypothetical protein